MLCELAAQVAPAQCLERDEAVAIEEEERPPPDEWRAELEKRRLELIDRNLAIALNDFDCNDNFVATIFLGSPGTSSEFGAWKRSNPDWEAASSCCGNALRCGVQRTRIRA